MARVKSSITQRSWGFGEVSDEFQQRPELREQSARKLRNVRITNAETICGRPGSCFVCEAPGASGFKAVSIAKNQEISMILVDGGFKKINKITGSEETVTGAPWSESEIKSMYCQDFGGKLLVGSTDVRPHVIDVEACTISEFEFKKNSDGSTAQPYENFHPGTTIQPSSISGQVTVVASGAVFQEEYVGTIIRCGGQEIEITGFTSPTEITGVFIQDGNPTCKFTVSDVTQYSVDDAVYGGNSFTEGTVVEVNLATSSLTVLKSDNINQFAIGEELIGPQISTLNPPTIQTLPINVEPAAKLDWDEQVFSDWRGWPGSSACHQGRLIFANICQLPTAYAFSAAGDFSCFEVGSADGDAIFDFVGKGSSERLLHAISSEDLIILSDKNAYYFDTRSGAPLSPVNNNNPIKFSTQGASDVRPVILDDSIAYVSEGGNRIIGALLTGDARRHWSTVHLTEYAPHLIRGPISLGSSEGDTEHPEQYLFVTNSDGTVAVMRHQRAPFEEKMGWVLWDNLNVKFLHMETLCGEIHAIAEKDEARALLRFEDTVFVDWGLDYESTNDVPTGLSVYGDRYWGISPKCHSVSGTVKAGCAFSKQIGLWPVEIEQTNRKGFVCQRNGRVSVYTKDTASFLYNGQRKPHYGEGDDLSAPPVLRTEKNKFVNLGRFQSADHLIEKPEPGPICVLAVSMEVQG